MTGTAIFAIQRLRLQQSLDEAGHGGRAPATRFVLSHSAETPSRAVWKAFR